MQVQTHESSLEQGEISVIDENIVTAWGKIRDGLRRDLGTQIFGQWIKTIELAGFDADSGTVSLRLPTEFALGWVAERYRLRLELAWKAALPAFTRLELATAPRSDTLALGGAGAAERRGQNGAANDRSPAAIASPAGPFAAMLDPRMTFERFIEGSSNRLAMRAAKKMAEDATIAFNPLYLQSPTGQGKTHLLHAMGHAVRTANPRANIIYMPAERFMVEFVTAMRRNDSMAFKEALRRADLFMIDDIQFIMGKSSTQEEFLHTLDSLAGQGKRVVVACDRAPQALDGIDQRLLSRLAMGLVADIQPADLELRKAILQNRVAQQDKCEVPGAVMDFLARSISRNVRELEGGLNKLIAYAQLTDMPITQELAETLLSDVLSACRRRITIDEIQRAVCDYYRIERQDMASKRRARAIARPRQVAMYLAKLMTPRSYPEIGRKFGGRDHSTVIHAVKLVEQLRAQDSEMDNDVRMLLRQLES
jgi:chromosomal replication initiator protein